VQPDRGGKESGVGQSPTPALQSLISALAPQARTVLRKYWILLLVIPALGFVGGVIPTWKSELESALLEQTDIALQNQRSSVSEERRMSGFEQMLSTPIKRFLAQRNDVDFATGLLLTFVGGRGLGAVLLTYCFVWIVGYAFAMVSVKLSARLSTRVYQGLRAQAFQNALRIGIGFNATGSNPSGEASWAISRGAEIVWSFIAQSIPMLLTLITLGTAFYIMATKSWKACAICLVAILLRLALSRLQARQLKSTRRGIEESRNRLAAHTDDILSHREAILVYDQADKYSKKIAGLVDEYGKRDQKIVFWETHYDTLADATAEIGLLLLLFGLLYLTFNGEDVRAVGDAYFFVSLYRRLQQPATRVLNFYDRYRADEALVQTFLGILASADKSPVPASESRANASGPDAVRFDSVDLAFAGKEVLRNCSFRIPRNRTTLIVGRSGAGKSTILRLIAGFLQPRSGVVYVDQLPTVHWPTNALHGLMSYCLQEGNVVDETVRENLEWCCPTALPDETLNKVLDRVRLVPDVQLGDRARILSYGMQQRLVLARLLLDNSPLLLLDEPFTGLDVFTLRDLRDEFRGVFRSGSRTILMVSHKLNFAAYADHVIVLKKDMSVEEGSPADLIKDSGSTFSALYSTAREELIVE